MHLAVFERIESLAGDCRDEAPAARNKVSTAGWLGRQDPLNYVYC